MSPAPFAASYLKLKRTQGFIAELEREMEAYKNSDPISGRPDFGSGSISLEWKGVGDAPGAIVGDAVHNMRTALDLMASELVRLNGRSDKDVYFPFCDSKDALPDAIKRRSFHKAGVAAVALLHQFAPYRGGNSSLRAIHDLDIQDKHTTIIVVGHTMKVEVTGHYNLDHRNDDRLTVQASDIHYIFGSDEGPFAGQRVIETLKELVELVDGIVKTFAAIPKSS